MPFYEYECPNCGYRDEVLQKINDKPLKKCPSCGKNGLKKLMSAPVFRLKGSGWYETDFKTDKDNKRNLADAKSESKPDAKTDAKADAVKPDSSKPDSSKADSPKVDSPKSDGPKADAPKSAEKASRSASKPAAKSAKPKSKPARAAKRPARR